MSYQLRVKFEVVDGDGNVVDYRGLPESTKRAFSPLQSTFDFHQQGNVNIAHQHLNRIYKILDEINYII